MIEIRMRGDRELVVRLGRMDAKVLKAMQGVVTRSSRETVSHIKTEHLTGGTSKTRLAVRTGHLRRTTDEKPTKRTGTTVTGGVRFGAKYAGVHVGPRGRKTTIRPKRAKYLVFPVERAGAAGRPLRWVSVKQVQIPTRVHPEDIRRWLLPRLKGSLEVALREVM